jgi:serine/threonine protein kinase
VGGFAAVYRAYDPKLDREVALKVPHVWTLEDNRLAQRFLREARAAARLDHPHIVSVYDSGSEAGVHFIATKFIEGCTLEEAVERGPVDFRKSADIVRQVAEALSYAHEAGIVHRDVKPGNILLDGRGKASLADFGLAFRQDAEGQWTEDGVILGTPAYMSPEQALGRQGDPQPAADQYSLGAVLYALLCGKPPFAGPAVTLIFHAVNTSPTPPREVNPAVPEELERICLKALAKDPPERYPTCRAMAEDLKRWLKGSPKPRSKHDTPAPVKVSALAVGPGVSQEPSKRDEAPINWKTPAVVVSAAAAVCLFVTLTTAVAGAGPVCLLIALVAFWAIHHLSPQKRLSPPAQTPDVRPEPPAAGQGGTHFPD